MIRKSKIILVLFGIFCLLFSPLSAEEEVEMKKVVMIVASKNFRDEEFLEPKKVLEENGVKVVIASSSLSEARGMLGERVKPDILIDNIKPQEYDAIIFVGGSGSSEYWDSPIAHRILREANGQGKIIGSICIAPVTLANAGILKDKRATCWFSEGEKLKAKGAIYTGRDLEVDGNIITASGPSVAKEFGEKILEKLK
jgi:protease I